MKYLFDRQGLLVLPGLTPGEGGPRELLFRIVRPSGRVQLDEVYIRELHTAITQWLEANT